MNKKGIQFNFSLLFSIFIGAVILYIAIFVVVKLIDNSQVQLDTFTAAEIGIILNPIETNLEEGKSAIIKFPTNTKVFNTCNTIGAFGTQGIRTQVDSGFSDGENRGFVNSFPNKYMFSSDIEEGEELHVFVKPFKMPYKVADLIFASSETFCFVNPPGFVEDDINNLDIKNVNVSFDNSYCEQNSKTVCFTEVGCDIDVDLVRNVVRKDGNEVFFVDNLIYGAIYSEKDLYECQVNRLMLRTNEIGNLLSKKALFLEGKGCSNGLSDNLDLYINKLEIENSFGLIGVKESADLIRRQNDRLNCKIF